MLGIDVLESQGFAAIKGKRVAVLSHTAGVNRQGMSTVDVLRHAPGVQVVALFGIEHGVNNEFSAGKNFEDYKDPRTGLPVLSLYNGRTRKPTKEQQDDIALGLKIAKEISRLDIGQTVLVKNGTVLAVEGFEGTNECIKRGGALGRGDAVMVKVSKPDQDLRFDVPVIGPVTLESCRDAGVRIIGIEAGRTIILERDRVTALAAQHKLSIFGL